MSRYAARLLSAPCGTMRSPCGARKQMRMGLFAERGEEEQKWRQLLTRR